MMLLTGPWRRTVAALRRQPGLLAMTLFAGVIVGIVSTSATLFVDSAGSGAVQVQWRRSCPSDIGPNVKWNVGELADPVVDPLAAEVGGFLPTDRTFTTKAFTVNNGDRTLALGFMARQGFRDHIDVIAEGTTGDLWLPDTFAAQIGVDVGSTITFGTTTISRPFVVHGIYRDLTTSPFDHYWCAVSRQFVAANLSTEDIPPPRGLIDSSVMVEYAQAAGVGVVSTGFVPLARTPLTLADARADAANTARFTKRLYVEGNDVLAETVGAEGLQYVAAPSISSGIGRLEQRATKVRDAVAAAVRPVSVLAIGSGLALASVLGLMWLRVKRNDAVALATLGISPAATGSKAGLETLLPLIAGSLAGAVLARYALVIYAPATDLEPGTFARALVLALVGAIAATLLVGLTAAIASRNLLGNIATAARVRWWMKVPWELALVAAAVVSWSGFRSASLVAVASATTASGADVAGVSAAALTFPLLVFITGGLLAARVWLVVLGRRRERGFTRFSVALAGRRLRHQVRSGAGLIACGVVAIAISVYGAGLVSSLTRTADAKAGLFVGSDVRFRIGGELPAGTPGATEVLRRSRAVYGGKEVDILVVDPATFENVAFWDSAFDDDSLATLLGRLRTGSDGMSEAFAIGAVDPAGTVGNTQGRPGSLQIRVQHLRAFPGASGSTRPTIVLSRTEADASGFKFSTEVWARGDYQFWNLELQRLGARPVFGITSKDAIDASTLLFASWAFEFVRALGAFVGFQVVIALLLQIASRQRKQALGFGFLQRMGLRARTHWRALALEVAAYAAAMLVAGIGLALAAVRVVGPRLDPLPTSPPPPLLVLPRVGIVAAIVVAAATAVFGTLAAQLLSRRTNLAEALRDDS